MSKILSPKSALYLVLTIVSLILWLENAVIQHSSAFKLLVLVAVLELGFLLFCRLKRWYGKEYVGLGIEDHFLKS
ncbi:MAG: hypothetical protein H7A33_07975 [Deltaproteobacteria bacterium]|nr:hypothetical protein [Deltaproteobacteria bacterium]